MRQEKQKRKEGCIACTYSAMDVVVAVGVPPRAPIDADVLIVLLLGPVAGRHRRDARPAPQCAHVAEHEATLGPGRLGGARAPRGTHGTALAAQSTQGTPARAERVEGRRGGGRRRSHYGTGSSALRDKSRQIVPRVTVCVRCASNVHGDRSAAHSSRRSAQNALGGTPTTLIPA